MTARRDGGTIRIQDICASHRQFFIWSFADCAIDYEIRYPKALAVSIHNANGDVRIASADAAVTVVNANGDINADNVASTVALTTKHGDVRASLAQNWHGSAIALHTSTGDVDLLVPARFAATLQASTRLGDVTNQANLHGGNITVTAATTLGDVRILRIR
jgi:DUF4097 and DUF4098 domain-containing protein YvlB